jgi:hypothetical protein
MRFIFAPKNAKIIRKYLQELVVRFSGKDRKMNHISPFLRVKRVKRKGILPRFMI